MKSNIVPFFIKYKIRGVKSQDFCQVVHLIDRGEHLTEEGLNKIR